MLATVATANSASTLRKKYSVICFSMLYINRRIHCVFYSIIIIIINIFIIIIIIIIIIVIIIIIIIDGSSFLARVLA